MKLKKIAAAALAVCLLLALGAGCAKKADGITVMGRKSDLEKAYLTKLFKLYEDARGVKLNIVPVEDARFEEEAAARFKKGQGPDVLLHFNNADLGRFDLEKDFLLLDDQPWVTDLTDSALAYSRNAQGGLLGLPFWESSVSGCYYNKTLLEKMGLNPASNQAEFDMLCDAILSYTRFDCYPICWAADGCSWMFQFGLDPVFADDPALLEAVNAGSAGYADIPAVADMVGWIAGAAKKGWFGDDYLKTGWSDIGAALASGRAVMTFIWDTWFYTDFTPGKYTVDDFALMPVFMNTAPEGTYEGGNLNMMMVNKNGRVEEALDFLSFCAEPEHYNAAFEGIATVSVFKGQTSNIQSPMVTAAQASLALHERVSTASSRVNGYSAEDVMEAVNALLRGRIDVAGCVKRMDELRQEELSSRPTG